MISESQNLREVFHATFAGATRDENNRPPLDKGDFRGVVFGCFENLLLTPSFCARTRNAIFRRVPHAAFFGATTDEINAFVIIVGSQGRLE